MSESMPIRRALISVSDKRGVTEFAHHLAKRGIELLSTGGTARTLRDAGLTVTDVSDHTGAPEIMEGRVKTLHPTIHGGILGRRDIDSDVMAEQNIAPIDLVVVNLYPFRDTIAKPDCSVADAIENIDIGGPTLLRAAAKNHRFVTVVVEPDDYETVLSDINSFDGAVTTTTRRRLAARAYAHTAAYDDAVAQYMGSLNEDDTHEVFADTFNQQWQHEQTLRYGENPHQRAAFYTEPNPPAGTLANAEQLQGKALSYNNLADTDAALTCVRAFDEMPACTIVKHANPCGVAMAISLEAAYQRAFATDPTSAFGGILAFNQTLDAATAEAILANQFAEVIVAPSVAEDARTVLARKKNLRVLAVGAFGNNNQPTMALKQITGGLLVQDNDNTLLNTDELQTVTNRAPTANEHQDLLFAWRVAKFVRSNAIVYARDGATIGIGAGQMSRVDSARIAELKAQDADLDVAGSVVASDAFFPFRDGVEAPARAGVRAVIQPGGSIRDDEVIAAADEADLAMLFTGVRHFRH